MVSVGSMLYRHGFSQRTGASECCIQQADAVYHSAGCGSSACQHCAFVMVGLLAEARRTHLLQTHVKRVVPDFRRVASHI